MTELEKLLAARDAADAADADAALEELEIIWRTANKARARAAIAKYAAETEHDLARATERAAWGDYYAELNKQKENSDERI